MAKRILVPLDQSQVAESMLPVVADAARGGGATVRLLHVAPIPPSQVDEHGRVLAYADQEMARLEAEGLDYLRTIEVKFGDTPVDSRVRFGDAVAEILEEAAAFDADLIAVATEGRSGLGRVALGSVAERVFRRGEAAVMLISPARGAQSRQ
jgi:nucleotide-binding universal stress UspA family protein